MAGEIFFDDVVETTTTTGTGAFALGGALVGYRAWSVIGNGGVAFYKCYAVDGNGVPTGQFEVGSGTYSSGGPTLSRDTVLSNSSNNTNHINFSVGTKRVALVFPATTCNSFGASGTNHRPGCVPDPGSVAGTKKLLREDASWYQLRLEDIMPGVYNVLNNSIQNLNGDNTNDDALPLETLLANLPTPGDTLYFPPATYLLSRAPTTVQGSLAQVHFPSIAGNSQGYPVYRLIGALPNSMIPATGAANISPTTGAILKSTATSGAVFGGAVTGGNFTLCMPWMEYLTIRAADNPQVTALDFSLIVQCFLNGMTIDTNVYNSDNVTQPSHSTYGIKMPGINCGSFCRLCNSLVMGYDTGVLFGEHTDIEGLQTWCCNNDAEINNQNHGMYVARWLSVRSRNGINVTASGTPHPRLRIDEWAIEYLDSSHQGTAPAWQLRQKDLIDASNLLYGSANVMPVEANVGPTTQFLKNGGANFTVTAF